MARNEAADRQRAMRRWEAGENPASIYRSLGYSARWFFKWLGRYREGAPDWFEPRSRRPRSQPQRTPQDIESLVTRVRHELDARGVFCGSQAIRWELESLAVHPVPSVSTISRILRRAQLVTRRHGRYEPTGRRYPAVVAQQPGDVHQSDFVGPCYLRGALRFYSLHSVDLATHRCAAEPLTQRSGPATIHALWASWQRLGMPKHQQVDNELVFYGSPAHPRGMGNLIRLCLRYGIEVWFIPPAEPWRNGVVEKFNDHWRQKFFTRTVLTSEAELRLESLRYEARHNTHYRYSALRGKTPLAALAASGVPLRFPPTLEPPRHPLPKPTRSRYHLVRFIRSDRVLDVFGERFRTPPEATYEYVRATIDVTAQRLRLYLDGRPIDEHSYPMR